MSNEAVKNVVSFENGVLKGYIPVNQQHTITKDDKGAWIAKPNMDYLYMAAVQKIILYLQLMLMMAYLCISCR